LTALLTTAFLVGIAGGVHCVAMCGGIVAALQAGEPQAARPGRPVLRQLGYSLGRMGTYAGAGATAGGLGSLGLLQSKILPVQLVLLVLANALIILLGLYLAGLGSSVLALERAGGTIWRAVRGLGARLGPAQSFPGAVAVGAVWGFLPCGLVYSVLATSLAAGSAGKGALVMAAFGLGTLPNLLGAGLAAGALARLASSRRLRLAAGLAVVALGVLGLWRVPGLPEHLRRGFHLH
jgi:sulfite exporter TauE/SafE